MDFKTRFQGKTSKITRDGDVEGNKADFDAPQHQLLPPARGNSIHKNDRLSNNGAADRSNLNITRNSRFSYKGSEQSTAKKQQDNESFISKPIEKLPAERIQINSMYNFDEQEIQYGAAKPGIASSAKRSKQNVVQSPVPQAIPQGINNSYVQMNQLGPNDYLLKTPNASSDRNLGLGMMHDTQNSNFSQQYSHNEYSVGGHLAPPENKGGNLYLNGAKNMADAIRQSQNNVVPDYMNNQAGNSIAMRMKQNRDAQFGVPTPSSNGYNNQTPISGHALYAQNPFADMGQNLNQSNYEQAQPSYMPVQEQVSSRQQLINQMKKPPSQQSHFQQLRESREKERHENLASVSKQIVSPEPIGHYQEDTQSRKSYGLPPSGSPMKRKVVQQQKQPIKPPSNYGKNSRQLSHNRIAPPQKGMDIGSRMSRDKSSDGILNRGQLQQLDNQQINTLQPPPDSMLQNQAQLQQQLALMQQQMLLIQQQQQMAGGLNNQFKSVYNPSPSMDPTKPSSNIIPNTTYDNSNGISRMIDQKDNISIAGSEKIRTYQKYNLKDYKEKQNSIKNQKMGGLGANIGGDKWEAAKRKKEVARQYADNLKQMNAIQSQTRSVIQPGSKEMSSRDKAIEFSKNNVPKPKQRKLSQAESSVSNQIRQLPDQDGDTSQYNGYNNQNNINVQQMINYNIRLDGQQQPTQIPQDMNRLMQDHDKYADEIDKIKMMLADNE